MSTGRLGNLWGLPRPVYRTLASRHNKVYTPPFDYDSPERCMFGSDYWHQYPVRDYEYRFNSWGFRDQDHEQWRGQTVDICVGDSVTVNLGGPGHHSWCSQLGRYWDVPVLNLGIDGLSCFDVPAVVDRARSTFRVRNVFIVYNLQIQDRETTHRTVITHRHENVAHKISAFARYAMVSGAHFQFDPPWTFNQLDLRELHREFPRAHAFLDSADLGLHRVRLQDLLVNQTLAAKYQELQGPSWPRYLEFCQRLIIGEDMTRAFRLHSDQQLISDYLQTHVTRVIQRLILANRDGWHLSEYANGLLAQYFHQQVLTTK